MVTAWAVVRNPLRTLKLSLITLNIGAAQFVVQEAIEITVSFLKSNLSSLTPRTTDGVSSSFAGAVK